MFSKIFADRQYHDKEIGRIALIALWSLKSLGDTFSAARVGSSIHSNLRMHHISGDSPNHPTWCSAHAIHEMHICLWDNSFMAIFYRLNNNVSRSVNDNHVNTEEDTASEQSSSSKEDTAWGYHHCQLQAEKGFKTIIKWSQHAISLLFSQTCMPKLHSSTNHKPIESSFVLIVEYSIAFCNR